MQGSEFLQGFVEFRFRPSANIHLGPIDGEVFSDMKPLTSATRSVSIVYSSAVSMERLISASDDSYFSGKVRNLNFGVKSSGLE
jgi:hypothetical protein